MRWYDVLDDEIGGAWRGLVFSPGPGRPVKPSLRVEAHNRRIRIQRDQEPLLWACVAEDYFDYEYLVASRPWSEGVHLVPPIRFESVREAGELEGPARSAYWARHYARALVDAEAGPIGAREYVLLTTDALLGSARWTAPSRLRAPSAEHWSEVRAQQRQDVCNWDSGEMTFPLSLVDPAGLSDGRVHAWRKPARAGELPPILLWWVSGLDRYVILDGAHRVAAALDEGIAPPCLVLTHWTSLPRPRPSGERWAPPPRPRPPAERAAIHQGLESAILAEPSERAPHRRKVEMSSVNRVLIEAFDDRPGPSWRTTAWPLGGGLERWHAQLRAELPAADLAAIQPGW